MSYIFHHTDLLLDTPNITEALKEMQIWIDALRSGEYKQDIGQLQTDKGFCCLGVACKVLIPENKLKLLPQTNLLLGVDAWAQPASPKWLKHLSNGIYNKFNVSLISLNDSLQITFDEIADILEAIFFERVFDGLELLTAGDYVPQWEVK